MGFARDVVSLGLVVVVGGSLIAGKAVAGLFKPARCHCGRRLAYQLPESGRWVCDGELHGHCRG